MDEDEEFDEDEETSASVSAVLYASALAECETLKLRLRTAECVLHDYKRQHATKISSWKPQSETRISAVTACMQAQAKAKPQPWIPAVDDFDLLPDA